jgi:hypothetical protein
MKSYIASSILATIILFAPLSASINATRYCERSNDSKRSGSEQARELILAGQHNRGSLSNRLYAFDSDTLETVGFFDLNGAPYSITASADGSRLFIEEIPEGESSCCALFALDLAKKKLKRLIFPSGPAAVTPDGRFMFTQRGPVGIEAFDAETLAHLPSIAAPGLYDLQASPDSRWLFGTTNFQRGFGPSLDIFDLYAKTLRRRLPLPNGFSGKGLWLGDEFYLYASDGKQFNIWKVTPQTSALGEPIKISLPDLNETGEEIWHIPVAAGGRLFLYEPFGYTIDRRRKQGEAASGGAIAIDAASGKVIARIAETSRFGKLMASGDGKWLYGLDSGKLEWSGPVRLLKLDALTGAVAAERVLDTDSWSMTVARLPSNLAPQGEVRTSFEAEQ